MSSQSSPASSTEFSVGQHRIGGLAPVFVIAEIGINHEGSAEVCARMIEEAAAAGADAIKLQTISPDANYVKGTESHRVFTGAELSRDETSAMFDLARARGMSAFTTCGDFDTLAWIDAIGPDAHKISSGLMTNIPLARAIARTGRPILMSTGMATTPEIDATVECLRAEKAAALAVFQCTSLYPCPPELASLASIRWFEDRYGCPAGFSDHTLGIDTAVGSVFAGAAMIEKHFSLDTARPGFDHRLSLAPDDFSAMVAAVRAASAVLGTPERSLSPEEEAQRAKFQRCLVAKKAIRAGDTFDTDTVAIKRPLSDRRGLPPSDYERLLGMTAARDLDPDAPITEQDLVS